MALPPSEVIGYDFCGTVTYLGSALHPSFTPDDRIAGIIHCCHYSHTGAFAEYLVANANLCFKIPDRVPFKESCTIGVGWISAMQALHQRLYSGDDRSSWGETDTVEHNFSWSPVS
jgi:NADPH:quinone reductase-like Zn-dependent oxidoreductase